MNKTMKKTIDKVFKWEDARPENVIIFGLGVGFIVFMLVLFIIQISYAIKHPIERPKILMMCTQPGVDCVEWVEPISRVTPKQSLLNE